MALSKNFHRFGVAIDFFEASAQQFKEAYLASGVSVRHGWKEARHPEA